MPNPFSRPNPTNEFNIYQREGDAQQVDWKQISEDVTTTVTDIEKDRATRKAEILKNFQDQQVTLKSLANKYDTRTLQQAVMKGTNNISLGLTAMYNEVKAGRLKPSEFALNQHNVQEGFTAIKSYADNFDPKFKEMTLRSQVQEDGQPINSELERSDAETLLSFNNLNNKGFAADENGNVNIVTYKPDGSIDESQTRPVSVLHALLYQKTDNMKLTPILEGINSDLGSLSLQAVSDANLGSGMRSLTTQEISRAETQFAQDLGDENNTEMKELLDLKVDQVIFSDEAASIFATSFMGYKSDVDGTESKKWLADPKNKGKSNPYILREFNNNSGIFQSFPTPDQMIEIKKGARRTILGSFTTSVAEKAERTNNKNRQINWSNAGGTTTPEDSIIYDALNKNFYATDPNSITEATRNLTQLINNNTNPEDEQLEIEFLPGTGLNNGIFEEGDGWVVFRPGYTDTDGNKVPAEKIDFYTNPSQLSNYAFTQQTGKENLTQYTREERISNKGKKIQRSIAQIMKEDGVNAAEAAKTFKAENNI